MHKTFCRYSCISRVQLKHVHYDIKFFKFFIPYSKTDITGRGDWVFIPCDSGTKSAYSLICYYFQKMNFENDDDFVFPPMRWNKTKKDWIYLSKRQWSYSAAYKAFKSLLNKCGIDPSGYSLHSMRMGGATDAFKNGVSMDIIDRQGRWRCPKSKFRYIKKSEEDYLKEIAKASKY